MNMYGENYENKYKLGQLSKLLPQFAKMTEDEIHQFLDRKEAEEMQQWTQENRERLIAEREKTMAYMEERSKGNTYPNLPSEPVEIGFGWTISPSWVDDHGFIKEDFSKGLRRTIRLSLDKNKKIYIH